MTDIEREVRAKAIQANEIAYTVIEVAQNKAPAEFVTLDFRYGIADALWDAGYRKVETSSPATREAVTEAKAEAWDEAIAAVAAWWQTPEDERGVIVNPYGTHPADRLLEDIEKGDDR